MSVEAKPGQASTTDVHVRVHSMHGHLIMVIRSSLTVSGQIQSRSSVSLELQEITVLRSQVSQQRNRLVQAPYLGHEPAFLLTQFRQLLQLLLGQVVLGDVFSF